MDKPLIPLLAACVLLAGCQLLHKSSAWNAVKSVQPPTEATTGTSREYAERVHRALSEAGVEHKIVTYRYERTMDRVPIVLERTAVIYKDESSPATPWWLTDGDRGPRPVWLPNDTVEKQIAFYVHSRVQLIDEWNFFPGGYRKDAPVNGSERPSAVTRIQPTSSAPKASAESPLFGPAWPLVASEDAPKAAPAAQPIAAPAPQPAPAAPAKRPLLTRILETLHLKRREPEAVAALEPQPAPPVAPAPAPAPAAATSAKPAEKAPAKPAAKPAAKKKSAKRDYAELFRKKHGAKYDSKSASDRKKMERLKEIS